MALAALGQGLGFFKLFFLPPHEHLLGTNEINITLVSNRAVCLQLKKAAFRNS